MLRSEALYEAHQEMPQNEQVKLTVSSGLRQCRILHQRTPLDVVTFLKDLNNKWHFGSSISFHELVVGVEECDNVSWKLKSFLCVLFVRRN